MTIPTLAYNPTSRNHRVKSFDKQCGEEQPIQYTLETSPSNAELDNMIRVAYRQIFNEQQLLKITRQRELESQLRNRQITMRDFIRCLLLSDSFRHLNFDTNSNYRFAEICIQRVLGRAVYNEQEKLSWSIVLATKGIQGFVDALLSTDEYLEAFGEDTIPYQRRRVLPQHESGELPFARMARYDSNHLDQLYLTGQLRPISRGPIDRSTEIYRRALVGVSAAATALLLTTVVLIISV
ncbi:Phycobilisome linker polypeptide [[Leptolyngbya] sp. PCC 7376]|uniref:phycobilisome rod-core linker polypeptide n=1 Tax=[Leptolyngbya] sp. PCC 7376 TaxID=111781 RepID=UPI00029EFD7A|nr:phycobilisome rod-core linker polypeptide [[Leptolyngbya] sp. PCC 7376]AFY36550.1 Phycobilisome linker polypeptide [[Leptolyngbya] sp. PCC 7376]